MFTKPLQKLFNSVDPTEKKRLMLAYEYAEKAHSGFLRKSGEPFFYHPVSVALRLWQKFKDVNLTMAGFLHDTVEDAEEVTIEEIEELFGSQVSFLVFAVTKVEGDKGATIHDTLNRLLTSGLTDVRALLLKLADREHNISTIRHLPDNKQVRMSFETQAIYQPLMNILHYQDNKTITEIQAIFDEYKKNHNINRATELKDKLCQTSFSQIDESLFGLTYRNPEKVVWQIHDAEIYKYLLKNKDFTEAIDNVVFEGSIEKISISFTFKKSFLLKDDRIQLKPLSFTS